MRPNRRVRSGRNQGGKSFIELLVATAILLLMATPLLSIFRDSMTSANAVQNTTALQQNVRASMNLIERDLFFAGGEITVGGVPVPTEFCPKGMLYPVTPENGTGPVTNGQPTDKVTILYSPLATQLLEQDAVDLYRINKIGTAGNQITLDVANGHPTAKSLKPGDILLMKSNTQAISALGYVTGVSGDDKVQFSSDDPLSINQSGDNSLIGKLSCANQGSSANCVDSAVAFKVDIIEYYVDNSDAVNADDRPVLMRRKNGKIPTPVGLNIEDFQITYVLDDGTSSSNPDKPVTIRQATVRVVGRSRSKVNSVDGYHHFPLERRVAIRNLAYEAEKQ